MGARIFLPPKSAMQSGLANTKKWVLEYVPAEKRKLDLLMGWVSSGDTQRQLRLEFDSKEEAISYAEREGIAYQLEEPMPRAMKPKSYAENFSFTRKSNWTH